LNLNPHPHTNHYKPPLPLSLNPDTCSLEQDTTTALFSPKNPNRKESDVLQQPASQRYLMTQISIPSESRRINVVNQMILIWGYV
jgi:hypothetical protein